MKVKKSNYGSIEITTEDSVACEIHYWEACKVPVMLTLSEKEAKKLYQELKKLFGRRKYVR